MLVKPLKYERTFPLFALHVEIMVLQLPAMLLEGGPRNVNIQSDYFRPSLVALCFSDDPMKGTLFILGRFWLHKVGLPKMNSNKEGLTAYGSPFRLVEDACQSSSG